MESNPSTSSKMWGIPIFSNYLLDASREGVYIGRKINSKEEVVFKLKKSSDSEHIFINKEFQIYKELEGIKRIPKLYSLGTQGIYHILIIEYLGQSLKQLLEYVGGKFSLATTLKICSQVLEIVKEIHNRGVVLRYLKPGNMVIGKESNKDYIYLIDFEIANILKMECIYHIKKVKVF